MQGYIIDFKPVRDDDLIVTILTKDQVLTTYRFYGARHSHINVGYKIDFETESNLKSNIPRLKDVLHLNFPWILDHQKMYHWQRFVKLFYDHLKDVDEVEDFYFELLSQLIHRIDKQNVIRALLEGYIKILEYEGRLHTEFECLLCEQEVNDQVSLIRGFLPTHPKCCMGRGFDKKKIQTLFDDTSTIDLTDEDCEYIWHILLLGI